MTHLGRRKKGRRMPPGVYAAGAGLALAAAVMVAIVLWTSPQPRSGGIALGAAAPSIALPATSGGQLTLAQLRGSKVVLYFYEGAG